MKVFVAWLVLFVTISIQAQESTDSPVPIESSLPKVTVAEAEQVPYATFSPYTAFGKARIMDSDGSATLHLLIPFKYALHSAMVGGDGKYVASTRVSFIPNRVKGSTPEFTVQMSMLSVPADVAMVYDIAGNQLSLAEASARLTRSVKVCILSQSFSEAPLQQYFATSLEKSLLFVHIPAEQIPKENTIESVASVRAETISSRPANPNAPLAHYCFESQKDSATNEGVGLCIFKNIARQNNSLLVNGLIGSGAPQCEVIDLDYNSFSIAVAFKAEIFASSKSTILSGGPRYSWFSLDRNPNGALSISLNGGSFVREIRGTRIAHGNWNTVAVSVHVPKREVLVCVNGNQRAIINLPEDFRSQVVEADIEEADKILHFGNSTSGSAFKGTIDNFMVFGRALTYSELQSLFHK